MSDRDESSGESSDSVIYPSDDETSRKERQILKIQRRRKRAFAEQFNDDVPLKASLIAPRLENDKENHENQKKSVVVRKKHQTPRIVLQPRKSLRLDGKRASYVGLEDDFSEPPVYRRRRSTGERRRYTPRSRAPRLVTFNPDALKGEIAYGAIKTYSTNGTTCHQCRQKTLDLKSQCYSPTCVGIRGQFCGYCLLGRYGEDVAVVLRDRDWKCPPCRMICNCSLCRTRYGKAPTGILKNFAQENGFKSVADYLKNIGDARLDDDADDESDSGPPNRNTRSNAIKEEVLYEQCRTNQPYVKLERLPADLE